MTRPAFITLITAAALSTAIATGFAQTSSLDLRTGEWQLTLNGMKLPPSALAQMPAAARAAFEAELGKPQTSTSCITAKDLADLNIGKLDEDDEKCTVTSRKTTRTTADFTRQCSGDEKRTDSMHVEATSREAFSATVKSTTPDGEMTMTMSGKWLAATCKAD